MPLPKTMKSLTAASSHVGSAACEKYRSKWVVAEIFSWTRVHPIFLKSRKVKAILAGFFLCRDNR